MRLRSAPESMRRFRNRYECNIAQQHINWLDDVASLPMQLLEQSLGILQIRCTKPFGEPHIDRRQQVDCLLVAHPIRKQDSMLIKVWNNSADEGDIDLPQPIGRSKKASLKAKWTRKLAKASRQKNRKRK